MFLQHWFQKSVWSSRRWDFSSPRDESPRHSPPPPRKPVRDPECSYNIGFKSQFGRRDVGIFHRREMNHRVTAHHRLENLSEILNVPTTLVSKVSLVVATLGFFIAAR